MASAAHRHNSLLGARLFLIAPGAPKDDVIAAGVERGLEGLCPHDQGVVVTMVKGIDARRATFFIRIGDELEAMLGREVISERDQRPELPGRVHVQQRERRCGGIECP